ncbi:retrovirus-related pol polyprotein from transposon TNT 1-94 [Tanacetum coccineum]|uniref:Retrovirus-related pol polyprotein from transposon TNT 1-94 n=1 Tax=Tanacetum coccineum TaxID=301880 RepID=A0ABQ4YV00_9ASTR
MAPTSVSLNFGAINHLARHDLVRGLPKIKFKKDHLCSACEIGKSKKKPHKPKSEDTNQEKLYLLHMDLCGPMRVASVNGKKYILVIIDDYSRFTWVKFLRIDNGTEFVNQTFREYYEKVGISCETSFSRSPKLNGVVERQNRTLIKAARIMLIYEKDPLFLWAEAVATACYTKNRSIIHLCHDKTPYELLHDKPPDLSFFHVFGALCYPINDSENLGKLQPKADIGIFIGYAPTKKAFFEFIIDVPDESLKQFISSSEPAASIGLPSSTAVDQDAPSAKASLDAIRIFSHLLLTMNMIVYQMDVKTTFLNDIMYEEVYISQPDEFVDQDNLNHVYKLKKALYGLKQAPQQRWILSIALTDYADSEIMRIPIILERRTIIERMQLLGDRLVSSSKRQKSAAIFSTEAEYIALSGCCAQVL